MPEHKETSYVAVDCMAQGCVLINDLCLLIWKILEESHLSMSLYVTLYASSVTSSVAYSDSWQLRCLWR